MPTAKNRLDKVAKSLTPKQAVIARMLEAHRFDSPMEYLVWSQERTEEATNFESLIQGVESTVRDRMKGELVENVDRAVRDAVRDAKFLDSLHAKINEHFATEARAIASRGLLLFERARVAEATHAESNADREHNWREDLSLLAIEVFTVKAAADQLASRYFDSHPILFKAFADQLEEFIRLIKGIVVMRDNAFSHARWNRRRGSKLHVGNPEKKDFNFDLEKLKQSIDASPMIKQLVDLAHIEALQFIGDRKGAAELLASLLRNRRDRLDP